MATNDNPSGNNLGDVLAGIVEQLERNSTTLSSGVQALNEGTRSTTAKLAGSAQNPVSAGGLGGRIGGAAINALNPLNSRNPVSFLSNLFLGPVFRGLFGLFSASDNRTEPILTPFVRAQDTASQLNARTNENGANERLFADAFGQARSAPPVAPTVQISIQALDARSILERGDDIATAVRQAMLTNHPINESMTEL